MHLKGKKERKINKTQLYAANKRLTSALRTHIGSKLRDTKRKFHSNGNQKRVRVAILISDKMELKSKTVSRDKEGH